MLRQTDRFRIFISFAVPGHLKAFGGILDLNEYTKYPGKQFRRMKRLLQEALHPPGPVKGDLIFFRVPVRRRNGHDVLQFKVSLPDLLYLPG